MAGTATQLNGAALSFADLSGVELQGAKIQGAWFHLTKLIGTQFISADLSGSTFLGADLTGADLTNAKLNGAMLIGANLSGADLSGADLSGAVLEIYIPRNEDADYYQKLTGNELIAKIAATDVLKSMYDPLILELNEVRLKPLLVDAQLQGTIYNDETTWPAGFEIPSSAVKK
jgi:hypothetical protein